MTATSQTSGRPVTHAKRARAGLHEHRRRDAQRDRRQHLIRDAEQRPQAVDAAERIDRAEVQEVAPARDDEPAADQHARIPARAAERRHDVAEQVLQHEARDARAGVDRRQDEQRLEHDREVIPNRQQRVAERAREDARHADGQRRRAAGAREQRAFAHLLRQRAHLLDGDGIAPDADRRDGVRRLARRRRRPGC